MRTTTGGAGPHSGPYISSTLRSLSANPVQDMRPEYHKAHLEWKTKVSPGSTPDVDSIGIHARRGDDQRQTCDRAPLGAGLFDCRDIGVSCTVSQQSRQRRRPPVPRVSRTNPVSSSRLFSLQGELVRHGYAALRCDKGIHQERAVFIALVALLFGWAGLSFMLRFCCRRLRRGLGHVVFGDRSAHNRFGRLWLSLLPLCFSSPVPA